MLDYQDSLAHLDSLALLVCQALLEILVIRDSLVMWE